MKHAGTTGICAVVAAGLFAAQAHAEETLFEQLPDLFNIIAADASGLDPEQRIADNFVLDTDVTVTAVQWWGSYIPIDLENGPSLDSFRLTFYTNRLNGFQNIPNEIILSVNPIVTSVDTGDDIAGVVNQYLYTAELAAPITLEAGEMYWFSPLNNTGLGDQDGTWGWEFSVESETNYFARREAADQEWSGTNAGTRDLAFRLIGTVDSVPCPADTTGDGLVDLADLNEVLAAFGQNSNNGDTNGDGVVDLADLNTVLAAFGTACE